MDTTFSPLKSLRIAGFRAFQDLAIPQLGSVNLIVGKNGVGKTCLLEALLIYMNQAAPQVIWQILESRDAGERSPEMEYALEALRHLFRGRERLQKSHVMSLSVGEAGEASRFVRFSLAWPLSQLTSKLRNFPGVKKERGPGILVETGSGTIIAESVNWFVEPLGPLQQSNQRCVFVPANGMDAAEITRLWDRVALTEAEEDVLSSLRLIQPEISKVNLIVPQQQGEKQNRIPVARLMDEPEPVPLRSLGEGMVRLMGIALALANARNGMLLLDEIESGLHYTVQPEMWKLIFATAKRLNIQVFAATHSWDSITAFQQAVQTYPTEGLLVRLERKNGNITSTVFDERKLTIATRDDIEVR